MSSEEDDDREVESVEEIDEAEEAESEWEKRVHACLRLRPMNKFETSRRSRNCVELHDDPRMLTVDSPLEGEYDFTFDRVFGEDSSQAEIFEESVSPLVSHLFEGYNCTVMAYGQSGSGKSYTMMGVDCGGFALEDHSDHAKPSAGTVQEREDEFTDGDGLIPRMASAIFDKIAKSSPHIEHTVRCSFIEIFLEKILDLLTPGGVGGVPLRIVENHASAGSTPEKRNPEGVKILGASELCCISKLDVVHLIRRGNAFRRASGIGTNSDSSRSHVVFILKLEQKNVVTGEIKQSTMHMLDLAGSDLSSMNAPASGDPQSQQNISVEALMNNQCLAALNTVVRAHMAHQKEAQEAAYRQSKLTRLLRPSLGGNCMTTIILTASPSSYNIGETMNTIRFGKCCRRIRNKPHANIEYSPFKYRKIIEEAQTRHQEEYKEWKEEELRLKSVVEWLTAECESLKMRSSDGLQSGKVQSDPSTSSGNTEKKTQENVTNAEDVSAKGSLGDGSDTGNGAQGEGLVGHSIFETDDLKDVQSQLQKMQKVLEDTSEARDNAENLVAELQSEVAVLRSKNEFFSAESKKAMQELIDAEYEIQIMSQRRRELEHDLRMSQFREKELAVFLRQFRRFYQRLLKHRGAHGNGSVQDNIAKVPGVPNLSEMIDIDKLMQEKGLIDEDELHDDFSLVSCERHVNDDKNLEVDLLQRELLKVTEQCIELQVTLKEERDSATNAALFAQGWGSMKKKFMGSQEQDPSAKEDITQRVILLERQLDKKNHDLQAIVWKMNELHVINETFSDNMGGREQRVMVLEKKLTDTQKQNKQLMLSTQESEKKLRRELEKMRALVDGMTTPLWQFGECGIPGMALASRIVVPIAAEISGNQMKAPSSNGNKK